MAEGQNVVIIRRKSKHGGHGHHGGSWKVAYADFVTAMMAFFLLLWLLNAVTEQQLNGIADYFAPESVSQTTSGAGGMLAGRSFDDTGARLGRGTDQIPEPGMTQNQQQQQQNQEFEEIKKQIEQRVQNDQQLRQMMSNLEFATTDEGLQIQIKDDQQTAMFANGSAQMTSRARELMSVVAQAVQEMPNNVSISGHTDATPFAGARRGYGNWELSADRALASRRQLIADGVDPKRITHVVGKADTDPLVPETPTAASNRRISITVLRDEADEKKGSSGGSSFVPFGQPGSIPSGGR